MKTIVAPSWSEYEIIDSGNKKKLERFGSVILIRPEISATWQPKQPFSQWKEAAHGEFIEEKGQSGEWIFSKEVPETWTIAYPLQQHKLNFSLRFTRFKHLGIFPEQSVNWENLHSFSQENKKILNLFAHTGGATGAAALAGAKVTHIDSVYPMVGWAKENGELNNLDSVKWICEDSVTFVEKEMRRGNKYDLVILDPPTFGQSKKGKRWKIEKDLPPLLSNIKDIVAPGGKIILNCYSVRLGTNKLDNILQQIFPSSKVNIDSLVLEDQNSKQINCGFLINITV